MLTPYVIPISQSGDPTALATASVTPVWLTLFHLAAGGTWAALEEVSVKPTLTVHSTGGFANAVVYSWDPATGGELAGWVDLGEAVTQNLERFVYVTTFAPPVATVAAGAVARATVDSDVVSGGTVTNDPYDYGQGDTLPIRRLTLAREDGSTWLSEGDTVTLIDRAPGGTVTTVSATIEVLGDDENAGVITAPAPPTTKAGNVYTNVRRLALDGSQETIMAPAIFTVLPIPGA